MNSRTMQETPEPIRGDQGTKDQDPRNVERNRQNPDMLVPPPTDGGTLNNLKFSYIGGEPLIYLEIFKSDHFADVSLNQWMANTPRDLLKEHVPVDDAFIDQHLSHIKHPNVKP